MNSAVRYCSHCRAPYPDGERFCPVDGGAIVEEDEAAPDPLIGQTIGGRYLVRRKVGQGGMGVVYEADHIALDKRVAVKFLLDKFTTDREVLARFHREARTASRIGHENIIDITDIGETDSDHRSFIVMEYLEGRDLGAELQESGALTPRRAVHIISQVLRGLAAAHDKGIVHRDMKPENVFLTNREEMRDFVKIMDFGISKIIDAHDSKVRLTETGAVVGTPIYMAPEQARAEQSIDHRADIYAAGVMFYEMLCGRPPFVATTYLELVTQHLFDTPPALSSMRPEVPPALEQAVMRALEKDPAARHQSARDFAQAIPPAEAFEGEVWDGLPTLQGQTSTPSGANAGGGAFAAPTAARSQNWQKGRSKAPLAMVGGALLLAAGMISIAVLSKGGSGEDRDKVAATPPADANGATQPHALPDASVEAPREVIVAPLTSVLEVDSRPKGANVYIDGKHRGVTPVVLDDIEIGDHELRLSLRGYQAIETVKHVRAGYTETFVAALATKSSGRRSHSTSSGRKRKSGDDSGKSPAPSKTPHESQPETQPDHAATPPVETTPGAEPNKKPNPYLNKKPNPYTR